MIALMMCVGACSGWWRILKLRNWFILVQPVWNDLSVVVVAPPTLKKFRVENKFGDRAEMENVDRAITLSPFRVRRRLRADRSLIFFS